MTDFQKSLLEPFLPQNIHWRVGSTSSDKTTGLALAYIDSRDVMDRLDDVCGVFGWSIRHDIAESGKVTAHISIKNPENGEWVSKSDGAGATDVEGDKGSYSDATKRAAVVWGIGRYLYDMKNVWVKIAPAGRSYKIDESEYRRLEGLLSKPETGKEPEKSIRQLCIDCGNAIDVAPTSELLEKHIKNNAVLISNISKLLPEGHKWLLEKIEDKRRTFNA